MVQKSNFLIFNDNEKNSNYLSEPYGINGTYRDFEYLIKLFNNEFQDRLVLSSFCDLREDSYDLIFIRDNKLKSRKQVNFLLKTKVDDNEKSLTITLTDEALKDMIGLLEEGFTYMKNYEDSFLQMSISFSQGLISFLEPVGIFIYYSGTYIFKKEDHSKDYMWFNN